MRLKKIAAAAAIAIAATGTALATGTPAHANPAHTYAVHPDEGYPSYYECVMVIKTIYWMYPNFHCIRTPDGLGWEIA